MKDSFTCCVYICASYPHAISMIRYMQHTRALVHTLIKMEEENHLLWDILLKVKANGQKGRKYGMHISEMLTHIQAFPEWHTIPLVISRVRDQGLDRVPSPEFQVFMLNEIINRVFIYLLFIFCCYFCSSLFFVCVLRSPKVRGTCDMTACMVDQVWQTWGLFDHAWFYVRSYVI